MRRWRTNARFHRPSGDDGRVITAALVDDLIDAELARQESAVDTARLAAFDKAAVLMRELIRAPRFIEFLTVPA